MHPYVKRITLSIGLIAASAVCSYAAPPVGWEANPPVHLRQYQTSAPSGYSPGQIRHAYGVDMLGGVLTNATGTGQKIALVEAYGNPNMQNDLNTFCAQFGIPSTTLTIAYPQGLPSKTDGGWALETALDVEWAHAIAPGASIIVVVAKSAAFSNLFGAVDYAAKQGATSVSMSWGGSEFSGEAKDDYHFNLPGITFLASSGDSGAGVSYPAASPYVTAVGGTSLPLDTSGNRTAAETAWSGSGGGTSAYESEPSFQPEWQSTGKRTVPDVSYNADPNTGVSVYTSVSYQGRKGWLAVGGTSAGAPQWAALVAIANANRASALSYTNGPLYSLGSPSTFGGYYIDIVSGSNGSTSPTDYAQPGYDEVTGIGTPIANSLVPALAAY